MGTCCQLPLNSGPEASCADAENLQQLGSLPGMWIRVAISLVLAGQMMFFGLGVNLTPPTLFSTTYWTLHGGLIVSSIVVMGILGPMLVRESWKSLKERQITVEGLFLMSALGAFIASLIGTFTGKGAVYYEVVAIVLSIYVVGKTLGLQTRQKAVEAVQQMREDFSWAHKFFPDGQMRRVSVSSIRIGDEVWITPGGPISVDGMILSGESFVKESALTGEPQATLKGPADRVLAGTYTVDGGLRVRMESKMRLIDRILSTVEEARTRPGKWQEQANALMQWFFPLVMLVSVGTFGYWMFAGPWTVALFNAMSVLLVACPCSLGLATPLAIWGGLSFLVSRGLVARSGQFLEQLCTIRHIIFDKTGTLSSGKLAIQREQWMSEENELQMRAWVAAVESGSTHPIAQTFEDWDADGWELVSLKVIPGKGLEGSIHKGANTHLVRIGTLAFMSEPLRESFKNALDEEARRPICIECDGAAIGIIYLQERFVKHLEAIMDSIKARGLSLSILSGDPHFTQTHLAGVPVISALSPQEKLERTQALENAGEPVLFVGDGINDAAAMSVASLSIAMGSGAALAKGVADAALLGERFETLDSAFAVAHSIRAKIRGNLLIAIVYNVVGMTLAATGYLHPVAAALLMLASSGIVSFRALKSAQIKELQGNAP